MSVLSISMDQGPSFHRVKALSALAQSNTPASETMTALRRGQELVVNETGEYPRVFHPRSCYVLDRVHM